MAPGDMGTVDVAGGVAPYDYETEMSGITVSVSDNVVTITANIDAEAGVGTVTIFDSGHPVNSVDIEVTITE